MMKKRRDDDQSDGLAYGNDNYPRYYNSAPIARQHPPLPQNYGQPPYSPLSGCPQHPPPQNYDQPPYLPLSGWSQHWDQGSQRYYYIEQTTGRKQWEPPANLFRQSPRPTSSHSQRYSGEQMRGNGIGEHSRQYLRPGSNSNAPQLSRNGSPLPRAMSIPPGYSLDTKTGQLVNTMLPPPGHHSAPVKYW